MPAASEHKRLPTILNNPSKIQLARLSHVYLAHPDLEKFDEFALDFGFQVARRDEDAIYYRGYGRDPCCYVAQRSPDSEKHFHGAAYLANSAEDFAKTTQLEGASEVRENKAPGGGQMVTLRSPSGTEIHVVWGVEERPAPAKAETATEVHKGGYNNALEKTRKGTFQRFKPGPAMVHKLGHYGFSTNLFFDDVLWYTSRFNFVPSDVLYEVDAVSGAEIDSLTFMHLDHGLTHTDHHTLFLFSATAPIANKHTLHHCSFEVEDFDTQLLGHEYLLQKQYRPVWGVGRHILGSQIFDYWKDPSGFSIEHYTDGDLVNVDNGTGREKSEGAASMYVWGPVRPLGGVAE